MNICKCYKTMERAWYDAFSQPICETVGICRGTKELDECACGGDKLLCDFYPTVRERAMKEADIDGAIAHFRYGIDCDIFSEPVTSYARLAVEALERMKED